VVAGSIDGVEFAEAWRDKGETLSAAKFSRSQNLFADRQALRTQDQDVRVTEEDRDVRTDDRRARAQVGFAV